MTFVPPGVDVAAASCVPYRLGDDALPLGRTTDLLAHEVGDGLLDQLARVVSHQFVEALARLRQYGLAPHVLAADEADLAEDALEHGLDARPLAVLRAGEHREAVERVAHELGHILGLEHRKDVGAAMHPTAPGLDVTDDELEVVERSADRIVGCRP